MSPSSSSIAVRRTGTPRRAAAGTARSNGAVGPVDPVLRRLTRLRTGDHRVVTCYLKLEQRDRSRGKYLIKLKNRIRAVVQSLPRLGLDRAQQEAVTRDLGRIAEYFRDPAALPATQGIAIFACEGLGLFEAVPLPMVHRSRLGVDASPLVKELASVEDEFGRILTVVLDRMGARFFEVTAYDVAELPSLRADNTRGSKFRGDEGSNWGEHNYHNRIRQEKQRHYESIARELFTVDRRKPAHGIVLAGPGPEAAAVEPFLHNYVADRVMGVVKLNPKDATPAVVHAATLAVRREHEREEERALVHEVEEAVGTGWALNGVAPVLHALAYGKVRSLLVHADASAPGFRCSLSGRLALTERDCRLEGDPLPVLDVIDDAIEEALRQHADVNVVFEAEAMERVKGLAALLRFR